MVQLIDGLTLYHGSYCEVSSPQLEKCAGKKDFGKGFYLTSSKEQAISFLNTSIAKAVAAGEIAVGQNYGYISEFQFIQKNDLKVKIFEDADAEWLHCIAGHRKRLSFSKVEEEMLKYDVIIGKIADDATNTTLTAYIAGAFGIMGSDEADAFCIRQLLPENLKDQFCFKTVSALDCLQFVKGEKIWVRK
jgi:hypothetical protein